MIQINKIIRLDESVINRIAAGEIIHRPCNVVKELIENSLDAGSSSISITLKAGGMELIKIKDNGSGIQPMDLPLICERHTTSKIHRHQDLDHLTTFGFRGEALASISQVADVTIVTKSADMPYALRSTYMSGKITSNQRCAGNQGTLITVQNLFKLVPSKRKLLKNDTEEYNRILDCIQKYAIHNPNVSFTLVKDQNNTALSVLSTFDSHKRIQQVYGTEASRYLNKVQFEDDRCHFKIYFTEIKQQLRFKQNIFALFVNNRLVDNNKINKQVKAAYDSIQSGYKPKLIYIQLIIDPNKVDVNVHPTKNQVCLLDEDIIVQSLYQVLSSSLIDSAINIRRPTPSSSKPNAMRKKQTLPENQTIKHYFKPILTSTTDKGLNTNSPSGSSNNSAVETPPPPLQSLAARMNLKTDINDGFINIDESADIPSFELRSKQSPTHFYNDNNSDMISQKIHILKTSISTREDPRLSKLLQGYSNIGSFDQLIKLIEYRGKYYIMNVSIISKEFFYQVLVSHIGSFGSLILKPPLSVQACLSLVHSLGNVDAMAFDIYAKKDLLFSYFKTEFVIEDNHTIYLKSLPMLIDHYTPTLEKIPLFISNIISKEMNSIDKIIHEFALLYACDTDKQWRAIESEILKGAFEAPQYLTTNGFIAEFDIPHMFIA